MKKFGLNLKPLYSEEEKSKGFQYADKPEKTFGLLFVFKEPKPVSFHMRNVRFPLEIGFFDSDWGFLGSKQMLPEKGIASNKGNVKYAIEALPGWVSVWKDSKKKTLARVAERLVEAGFELISQKDVSEQLVGKKKAILEKGIAAIQSVFGKGKVQYLHPNSPFVEAHIRWEKGDLSKAEELLKKGFKKGKMQAGETQRFYIRSENDGLSTNLEVQKATTGLFSKIVVKERIVPQVVQIA